MLYIATEKSNSEKGTRYDFDELKDDDIEYLCDDSISTQILERIADSGVNFDKCQAPIDRLMASLSGIAADQRDLNHGEFFYLDQVPNTFKKVVSLPVRLFVTES